MAEQRPPEPSRDQQPGRRPAELSRLVATLLGVVLIIGALNNLPVRLSNQFLPEIPAPGVPIARLFVGLVGLLVVLWGLAAVIEAPLAWLSQWWSRWQHRGNVAIVAPAPAKAPGLPARPATLGRDPQLTELVSNLLAEPPRPTVILGAPGIGKTNLTLAALHDLAVAARYGGRRIFVRCEGSTSATATVTELAAVLGIPLTAGNLKDACLQHLTEAPAVVCLDNAETPWEADTLQTEDLFAQLASVGALVASLRGAERPGGLAWGSPVRLLPLDRPAAAALFMSVAPPGFNALGLDALLEEMGGVPLAIELLAYAAEGERLESLVSRWRAERVQLLHRGAADHRLLSVAVSVEISWSGPLMTEPARRLLATLGRLPDGVTRADIHLLMPGDGLAAASTLRRRGLAFDDAGRLRTYPPIRHHVEASHPPTDVDWERTVAHYRHLATELGSRVGWHGGAEAVERLAAETANLTASLLRPGQGYDAASGLDSVHALCDLARFTGVDIRMLFNEALRVADIARDGRRLAQAHEDLACIALERSDHEGARARYEEALALYRQVGHVLGEANCIKSLGDVARERSDHEGARARYEEALPLYREVGHVLGEANCIKGLGDVALERSDHEGARGRYEDALPLYRQVGNVLGEANCIKSLGDIARERSDHDGAQAHYEKALLLYRQVGHVLGEANCIKGLGDVALELSDPEAARARYEDALPLYRQVGNVLGEANCIKSVGDIALERSDNEGARARYEEALPLYRQVGHVLGEANYIKGLGDVALERSDNEAARACYDEALPLYRQVGNVLGEANCITGLGDVALGRSDNEGARARYEEALGLYERIAQPFSIGWTHRRLARVSTDDQDRQRHVDSARSAWRGIGRDDLIAGLDRQFPGAVRNADS